MFPKHFEVTCSNVGFASPLPFASLKSTSAGFEPPGRVILHSLKHCSPLSVFLAPVWVGLEA